MPRYALVCHACDHRYEDFAHMAQRPFLRCPKCAGVVDTDWSDGRAPAVEQEWHGSKRFSMGLLITDEERDDVLRECPTVELNRAGQLVSKNRRHHRKQLKELSAFKAREDQKAAPQIEAQRNAREKAIRDFQFSTKTKEMIRGYLSRRKQRA